MIQFPGAINKIFVMYDASSPEIPSNDKFIDSEVGISAQTTPRRP